MQTFLRRYKSLTESGKFHNARLSSALHCFGWVFSRTIKSTQGGYLHHGKRIPVKRKANLPLGRPVKRKENLPLGRPKSMKLAQYPLSRYSMPNWKKAPGKGLH